MMKAFESFLTLPEPGRLRVEFDGVEDLLSQLFELAHSAAQDFERFRNAVESSQNSQKV